MGSYVKGAIALVLLGMLVGFQWTTTVTKKRPAAAKPAVKTYVGIAFGHTDSNSTAGPGPQSVTPPTMASGDLAVLFAVNRSANVGIVLSGAGGQTWDSSAPPMRSANSSGRLMWCKFNGTWSSNPSMQSASGTTALTVGLIAFRARDTSAHTWSLDGTADTARYAAAARFTVSAKSSTVDSTCGVIIVYTSDDNTMAITSGSAWTQVTGSGWQNVSGSDQVTDPLYQLKSAAGSYDAVADTQKTNGNDAGGSIIAIWK